MPLEFHNHEPPSPSEIIKAVCGIGMDIFWNHPTSLQGMCVVADQLILGVFWVKLPSFCIGNPTGIVGDVGDVLLYS